MSFVADSVIELAFVHGVSGFESGCDYKLVVVGTGNCQLVGGNFHSTSFHSYIDEVSVLGHFFVKFLVAFKIAEAVVGEFGSRVEGIESSERIKPCVRSVFAVRIFTVYNIVEFTRLIIKRHFDFVGSSVFGCERNKVGYFGYFVGVVGVAFKVVSGHFTRLIVIAVEA